MLQGNVVWTQKCWGNIPEINEQNVTHQIGRNVQVYVDDMLVKRLREDDHLDDLRKTFNTFGSYNIKLNSNKCAFGVMVGKFLGFMVSLRGIKVNSDKIRAIMELELLKTIKEV